MRVPAADLLLFIGYTLASVAGLLIMKSQLAQASLAWHHAEIFTTPVLLVCLGAALYITSFLIWILILARYELSVAYPVCIGLTMAVTVLGASILLGEDVGLFRVIGIALVVGGIWLTTNS